MDPVERYLHDLARIRSSGGGTSETSYYGPLENLLNDIGAGLKPRIHLEWTIGPDKDVQVLGSLLLWPFGTATSTPPAPSPFGL